MRRVLCCPASSFSDARLQLMAPPSLIPLFQDWLKKAGNATALQAPQSLWLPNPVPASSTPSTSTASTGTSQNAAAAKTLDSSSTAPTGTINQEAGASQPVNSVVAAVKASFMLLAVAAAGAVLLLSW